MESVVKPAFLISASAANVLTGSPSTVPTSLEVQFTNLYPLSADAVTNASGYAGFVVLKLPSASFSLVTTSSRRPSTLPLADAV